METIALKLLEREEINVNQVDENEYTALKWAKQNKMKSVINRINKPKLINK